ncbi:hypothetical protein H632_c115p1 [Helicosporidium sp. ATCC 50920]|nr:hypothetical protein H632_c115p1 [Helicosporidium sp. ATCC 50920]|eukprot:KDD76759.1 hypothetical protein H632_c115p1 [Helicosporidium sp. ATCC 50920]
MSLWPTQPPPAVTDLTGRVFGLWTLTTCMMCLICARDPTNPAIYGATLGTFLIALGHFVTELVWFRTMTLRAAAPVLIIASVSSLWMIAGWSYYTRDAALIEPSISEEVTATTRGLYKDE